MNPCRLPVFLALIALAAGCTKTATVAVPKYDVLVAADGSGEYRSVQAAVNAARPGDVIYVKPGVYNERVEVSRSGNIRLVGAGPDRTVIDAGQEYAALTVSVDGCHIEGFALRNASSHGLYVKSSGNSVSRCLIVSNGDRGVYLSGLGGSPSVRMAHCTVADNAISGIYVPTGNPDTEVTDCILAFNGRALVSDGDGNGMRVESNCAFEPSGDVELAGEGRGNIRQDPVFADRSAGDYRLGRGSPCIGTARNGGNIGCF